MSACTIRFRLDGAGPAVYLVDLEGQHFLYSRGELGARIADEQLTAMLPSRTTRWIAASGTLTVWQDGRSDMPEAPAHLLAYDSSLCADFGPI